MRMWTSGEDCRLLCGIYRFGLNSWAQVAKFVGSSRTRAQCAQRWSRGLDPRICKRSWDPGDDRKLMRLVSEFGECSWMKVSSLMGNRSDVQCRYRYCQLRKEPPDRLGVPGIQMRIPPVEELLMKGVWGR
jgi:hypothetical protein